MPALRILVVDDRPDTPESLARVLALYGHEARAVRSCADARAAADALRPDVAILDLGLPDGDGLGLVRDLLARLPRRPLLIALTGYHDREEEARAAGFDHVLLKPADPRAIDVLIRAPRA